MAAHPVITALVICLAVQAVFFAFAASLKTDKVTDLS
jgi:multisubunit Na+/H+ antiporter MnhC subunit